MGCMAYEKVGGRAYKLMVGTAMECGRYVVDHPVGPRGGSTHVRRLPK